MFKSQLGGRGGRDGDGKIPWEEDGNEPTRHQQGMLQGGDTARAWSNFHSAKNKMFLSNSCNPQGQYNCNDMQKPHGIAPPPDTIQEQENEEKYTPGAHNQLQATYLRSCPKAEPSQRMGENKFLGLPTVSCVAQHNACMSACQGGALLEMLRGLQRCNRCTARTTGQNCTQGKTLQPR